MKDNWLLLVSNIKGLHVEQIYNFLFNLGYVNIILKNGEVFYEGEEKFKIENEQRWDKQFEEYEKEKDENYLHQ